MFYWKLQQKTRIERIIGFILAIWGIVFYSQLLSTMTEQFRVLFLTEINISGLKMNVPDGFVWAV